jgi:hypothetical protein
MEPLAVGVQRSEDLYQTTGALLAHLVNEELGAVFRSITVKSSVTIEDVVYPLAGPDRVAAALRAVGARLLVIFSKRKTLRDLQIVSDEESNDRDNVFAQQRKEESGGGSVRRSSQ